MRSKSTLKSSFDYTAAPESGTKDNFDFELLEDLDEELDFEPQVGQAVWIKSKGDNETWYKGVVMNGSRKGPVRQGKQGTFYPVKCPTNHRRYFAPLLGDIKPDVPRVRQLLEDAGIVP